MTNENGVYIFEDVPYGKYVLIVEYEQYGETTKPIDVSYLENGIACKEINENIRIGESRWEELSNSASGGGISNNAGVSYSPSIAINDSDNPVVAWCDYTLGDPEIYIKQWSGSEWEEIGSGSASNGGISNSTGNSMYPSLAINDSGDIFIAWTEEISEENYEIYLKKWSGSNWEEVGNSASGGGISVSTGISYLPSLAINTSGNPVVAWSEYAINNIEIYLKQWSGSNWDEIGGSASGGGISSNSGSSDYPALVIDNTGKAVVCWIDGTSGSEEIYIRKWSGSNWDEIGSGSASGQGMSNIEHSIWPSLSLDNSNNPMVLWTGVIGWRLYLRKYDGSNWVGLGDSDSGDGIISEHTENSCLAVNSAGNPIAAWKYYTNNSYNIYVKQWSGEEWEGFGGSASGGGISNTSSHSKLPDVATDSSDNISVAWVEDANGNNEIYVKRWVSGN